MRNPVNASTLIHDLAYEADAVGHEAEDTTAIAQRKTPPAEPGALAVSGERRDENMRWINRAVTYSPVP